MVTEDTIRRQLSRTLETTRLEGLGERYQGKVRDCYIDRAAGRRVIVSTDRISAFDRVLGTVPFKGQVLNQLSAWWFRKGGEVARNHVIAVPDPQVTVAHECAPLRVEMIVRAYMAGVTTTSIWYNYERGVRDFCGNALPEGLRKNEPLPKPILTPTTKAEDGAHDRNTSRDELIAAGGIRAEDFDAAAEMAFALFVLGQRWAASRGLILADTKYELGRTPGGELVFIDEIHTPDSSRYWYADDYEERWRRGEEPRALDKEYVRRWFVDHGYRGEGAPPPFADDVRVEAARRYIELFEIVTGERFVADETEPEERMRRNLAAFVRPAGVAKRTPGGEAAPR